MTGRAGPRRRESQPDREPELFPDPQPSRAHADAAPPKRAESLTPGESPSAALPVDDLAQLIRNMVRGSFPQLWVAGEVTQFTRHRNGHWYFTLKGEQSALRCVMWASSTWRVPTAPNEGMRIVVLGSLDVFTGRTELQLVVHTLQGQGDGLWRKAFEETRARLDADGLLSESRKRPLPFFPRRVAIVTSADGAALHDIVSVTRSRNPLVELVLVPAFVQGEEAPRSLRIALDRAYRWGGADVIVIGRGGGSREELWAFNDEKLARKVAESPVPIVSAVGHEVDVTICDLVADFRAPTPSAAAERIVPVLRDVRQLVERLGQRLIAAPTAAARRRREALSALARRIALGARGVVGERRLKVAGLSGRLHALSPLATLTRGYAVVVDAEGRTVTRIAQVTSGSHIAVRVHDGSFGATVDQVSPLPAVDGSANT